MKYFPRIRSKNHSVNALRRSNRGLPALPVKSVVRFGSITPTSEVFRNAPKNSVVEINTVEAVKNSSSKLKMKRLFDEAKVPHPDWYTFSSKKDAEYVLKAEKSEMAVSKLPYPIVLKRFFGSKGRGMQLIESKEAYQSIIGALPKDYKNTYYLESYVNMVREYRLHCTKDGCFYACRKMLKEGSTDRWYRNDSNCVWYIETNPQFNKPANWAKIEEACVRALVEVGLDIGAFDVRVQASSKKDPSFVLIEVNSAPAFGEITENKYKELLPKLIISKINA